MTVRRSPAIHETPYPLALLADPRGDIRDLYAATLAKLVGRFDHAEDGREALVKALATPPSIVIADTRLPFIDGYALCGLIRSDPATQSIPVLLIAADPRPADIQRAERVGADVLVPKPFLHEVLYAELQRLAKKSSELRDRSRAALERIPEQLARSEELLTRSRAGREMRSHAHRRHETTTPASPPPALVCPRCDRPLHYVRSQIGGVSAGNPEQWDYFDCLNGCGDFQYRQRTRKLRQV
jgi:CheY-like chemotaxis protein